MKVNPGLISIIIIVILSACEKTEKVEDFPRHESKLVANCFFRSDTPFMFQLSKSLSPLDNAPFRIMNNNSAYIRVYEDNIMFDSFRVSNDIFIGNSAKLPKANTKYRFECFYPGFGFVTGEDYLPDTVKFVKIKGFNTIRRTYDSYSSDSSKYVDHSSEMDISLETSNLYGDYLYVEIKMINKDTFYSFGYEPYIYPEEVGGKYETETAGGRVFISDDGAKISSLKIRWDYEGKYKNGAVRNEYIVRVYSCSQNAFEYLRRSSLQVENDGDPFAQPSPISNNIVNGYGIFGGISVQEFKIEF